jgi:hypothetical protein
MTKKFKLLKDLPGIKAGTIAEWNGMLEEYVFASAVGYTEEEMKKYPDWFQEIPDKWPRDIRIEVQEMAMGGYLLTVYTQFETKQAAEEMRDKIKELLGGEGE